MPKATQLSSGSAGLDAVQPDSQAHAHHHSSILSEGNVALKQAFILLSCWHREGGQAVRKGSPEWGGVSLPLPSSPCASFHLCIPLKLFVYISVPFIRPVSGSHPWLNIRVSLRKITMPRTHSKPNKSESSGLGLWHSHIF